MDLYPAVDVAGGRVARVPPGLPDEPLAVARSFAAARWVHFVDLDRAYGRGDQRALLRRFLADAGVRVQVGGGLVAEDAIDEVLTWGAARVVVGVQAAADGTLLDRLCARHGADRLAAAVETDGARLKPRGAAATPIALSPEELVRHVAEHGVRTVVYTDVTRDGSLGGPDLEGAAAFVRDGMRVIASGGVSSLADLTRARDAGLAGVIVGRALHEGRFTLAEALACL